MAPPAAAQRGKFSYVDANLMCVGSGCSAPIQCRAADPSSWILCGPSGAVVTLSESGTVADFEGTIEADGFSCETPGCIAATEIADVYVLNAGDTMTGTLTLSSDAPQLSLAITAPIDAQDETDYDGSPATEGTFAAGVGYEVGHVITLSDASTVVVDAATSPVADPPDNGNVTEFTVASDASTGAIAGATLTQASTNGSGTGFSLTLGADNVETTTWNVSAQPGGTTFDGTLTLSPASGNALTATAGNVALSDATNMTMTITALGVDSTSSVYLTNDARNYQIANRGVSSDRFDIRDVTAGTYPFVIDAATPTSTLRLSSSGNVGIGTASPAEVLDIQQAAASVRVQVGNTTAASTGNYVFLTQNLMTSTQSRAALRIRTSFSNVTDATRTSLAEFLTSDAGASTTPLALSGGRVGIGTITPDHNLHSVGTFCAEPADTAGACTNGVRASSGALTVSDILKITPKATAPATCTAATDIYTDTSGALCFCTATNTWTNVSGVGSCA